MIDGPFVSEAIGDHSERKEGNDATTTFVFRSFQHVPIMPYPLDFVPS